MPCPTLAIKKGDAVSASVAAASIVAKVTRDRMMDELHRRYPAFGFDRNKGYGTGEHREAIERLGPTPIHRLSFDGVGQPSLPGIGRGVVAPAEKLEGMMNDDDIERFEEERELELYREYRDVLPMFAYVIETERRFYLANTVELTTPRRRLGRGRAHRRVGVGHVPPGAVRLERPGDDAPRRERRGALPSGEPTTIPDSPSTPPAPLSVLPTSVPP